MKTLITAPTRNMLLSAVAVTMLAIPQFAMASGDVAKINLAFDTSELNSVAGQERLYTKMQDAAHKLCGSTSIQMTGSVRMTEANSECYEGTLTAAVKRLGNDAITALHSQSAES